MSFLGPCFCPARRTDSRLSQRGVRRGLGRGREGLGFGITLPVKRTPSAPQWGRLFLSWGPIIFLRFKRDEVIGLGITLPFSPRTLMACEISQNFLVGVRITTAPIGAMHYDSPHAQEM